jgi:hypothetical protein
MDDVQITHSGDYNENKGSVLKEFLIILIIIITFAGVAGLSFYLGTRTANETIPDENQPSPTPTPGLTLSENIQIPTSVISQKPIPTSKPSPTPVPLIKTKILTSSASLDGFRSSNSGGNSSLEIRAGRNSTLVTRGFISFDLDELPDNADIQSASIKLYQAKIIGNPYIAGGALKIDHLTYGDGLDASDYASPALSTNFANVTNSVTLEWKETDVTARLKDDIANARSVSQYRIHFQTEVTGGDVTGDFVYLESADNNLGSGNSPQLVVKYY